MSTWNPISTDLIFSKNDSEDPRLGDCLEKAVTSSQMTRQEATDFLIWGYPDDEGIRLNGGRPGAAHAPTEIRRVFYKMTMDPRIMDPRILDPRTTWLPKISDLGDLSIEMPLGKRHDEGALLAEKACDQNIPWASLGGGHDYGYADGAGFLRSHLKNQLKNQLKKKTKESSAAKPLIVNFDAHLDVRPSDKNLIENLNSGTPFYRLLQEFPQQFEFVEIGLQPQCNSAYHWKWAQDRGAHLIALDEVESMGLLAILKRTLLPFLGRAVWISLDIDAVTSSEAPGCSQSWTTGLRTADILACFAWLSENFIWKAFSVYEVSPPLDSDNRTSKLAALFLHRYLHCALSRSDGISPVKEHS